MTKKPKPKKKTTSSPKKSANKHVARHKRKAPPMAPPRKRGPSKPRPLKPFSEEPSFEETEGEPDDGLEDVPPEPESEPEQPEPPRRATVVASPPSPPPAPPPEVAEYAKPPTRTDELTNKATAYQAKTPVDVPQQKDIADQVRKANDEIRFLKGTPV